MPKLGSHRRSIKLAASSFAAVLISYLFVCYFLIPELWIFHDSRRLSQFNTMLTTTEQDIPGDPINVGFVGVKEQVIRAFTAADWDPADKITLLTSVEIALSVALDRPDLDAPVSALLFEGRKQDLAFEKSVGKSADEQHHVRFWMTTSPGPDGRPLWIGAASFDRGVGISHDTGELPTTSDRILMLTAILSLAICGRPGRSPRPMSARVLGRRRRAEMAAGILISLMGKQSSPF